MRKEEFMKRLETLLADISEEEKREALSYYWSYFDDAGEENEERILRELESPEKVAATIKDDLKMDQGADSGAYSKIRILSFDNNSIISITFLKSAIKSSEQTLACS